jgi:hypothetical protein
VKDEPNICQDQFDHIGYASEQLECPKDGVTQKQIEANLIKSLRANKILPPDESDAGGDV